MSGNSVGSKVSNATPNNVAKPGGKAVSGSDQMTPRSYVSFTINGKNFQVNGEHSLETPLADFIRNVAGLKGTKISCREGGCGVCVVSAEKYDPLTKKSITISINSCLCPVYSCDGLDITTVEGLGDKTKGYHPIQSRLADYNGTQCGFCSPGMVMNMYSLLKENPKPTSKDVENLYDGNICRCTGYRPIMDAMKSFSTDAPQSSTLPCGLIDVEDLKCTGKGQGICNGVCKVNNGKTGPVQITVGDKQWLRPTTLAETFNTMKTMLAQKKTVRPFVGNTSVGIFKDDGPFDVYIDLKGVEELYQISDGKPVTFGSNVSLSSVKDLLHKISSQQGYGFIKGLLHHVDLVASKSVRDCGGWAGNVMMKHKHPDFLSDIFVILETAGAVLSIGDGSKVKKVSPVELLKEDMNGKLLLQCELPPRDASYFVQTYKAMPRARFSHAYANAGFVMKVDKAKNYTVTEKPAIIFGGFGANLNRAVQLETYLTGKSLLDPSVLTGALLVIEKETQTTADYVMPSPKCRTGLVQAFFYKFLLQVCEDKVPASLKSGMNNLDRVLSKGQRKFATDKQRWPVNQPLMNTHGTTQTAGEAEYVNDIPTVPGELYAAFVIAAVGNAKLGSMDATEALKIPGVVKFITAKDIPGKNNISGFGPEEFLVSEDILYAGQAIAMIVAESQIIADAAVKAVVVTYKDKKKPILTFQDAIKNKSFHQDPIQEDTIGDTKAGLAAAHKVIKGIIECGTQAHFPMETHVCLTVPKEDGYNLYSATQWMDYVQNAVAQVLGVPCISVNTEVRRLGGAYGAKLSRSFHTAAGSALAAHLLQRPVRLMVTLNTMLEMCGKRFPYYADYEVGVSAEGKLLAVDAKIYGDCGSNMNDCTVKEALHILDNAYQCDNWHLYGVAVKTNTPPNTYCRTPGYTPGIFIMESIMEHVAKSLNKDPTDIRKLNLYKEGQTALNKQVLKFCNVSQIYDQLIKSAEVKEREQKVAEFNKNNRWKKRGLSVLPMKYGVAWHWFIGSSIVSIYHHDGTVAIAHGGVEMGQGINTKIIQVAAQALDLPVDMIKCKPNTSTSNANQMASGGAITSEVCCKAVAECCKELKERLEPIKKNLPADTPWTGLVQAAYWQKVDLSARHYISPSGPGPEYYIYAACCTEVELDVLTGETVTLRTDILYDCGKSLNPELDIGQVEGAFVMGLGYWMTEKTKFNPETGRNLTHGTWEYKVPLSKDIPRDFRVELLDEAPKPVGFMGSKTAGEPPLVLSSSVLFAAKHAAEAARADIGKGSEYFPLNGPATVEALQQACLVEPQHLKLTV